MGLLEERPAFIERLDRAGVISQPRSLYPDMNPFTQKINESEYYRGITYKVHGFWSVESVRIHQTKDSKNEPWKEPVINWSTGGRDHNEEKDNLIASECFARAVLNAVEIAKEWKVKP